MPQFTGPVKIAMRDEGETIRCYAMSLDEKFKRELLSISRGFISLPGMKERVLDLCREGMSLLFEEATGIRPTSWDEYPAPPLN